MTVLRVQPFPLPDALEDRRVTLVGVGADDEKDVGEVGIGIAPRRFVLAVGGDVAAGRGRHAQPGVAVDVVGADAGLEQLVRRIGFFGEELSRTVEGHRVAAELANAVRESRAHQAHRFVPRRVHEPAVLPDFRRREPARNASQFRQHRALDAEHALVVREFVAAHVDDAAVRHADHDAAAGAAEPAHRLGPTVDGLLSVDEELEAAPGRRAGADRGRHAAEREEHFAPADVRCGLGAAIVGVVVRTHGRPLFGSAITCTGNSFLVAITTILSSRRRLVRRTGASSHKR